MTTAPPEVAEYQHVLDGTLFRVIAVPEHRMIYVLLGYDGTLTAETFNGRKLAEVPDGARTAVEAYAAAHEEARP